MPEKDCINWVTSAKQSHGILLCMFLTRITFFGIPLSFSFSFMICPEFYLDQMVDFVREGFLGSSHEFRNRQELFTRILLLYPFKCVSIYADHVFLCRFQNPIENGQHANSTIEDVKIMNQRSHILYEQLKGFVQRMDMNVAKKDLPPKTVFVIAVKLSPLQRKLYKKFLDMHGFTNDKVSSEKIRKSFFAGYQALAQVHSLVRL